MGVNVFWNGVYDYGMLFALTLFLTRFWIFKIVFEPVLGAGIFDSTEVLLI